MLDRAPLDEGIIDLCNESGVGFISFSPLAQGLLTNRYLNGIPEDSRMSKEKFLKKSMLTEELLDQLRAAIEQAASGQIADGTVTTAKLANKAVTADKLADDIPYTKFGLSADQVRKITFGTADPSGGSDGDIYIQYT